MSALRVCSGTRPSISFSRRGDFRARDSALDDYLDPLSPCLHSSLRSLSYCTPVRHPALQLVGDVSGYEIGVQLRLGYLHDVELNALAGHPFELGPESLYPLSIPSYEDPRPGRVNVYDHVLGASVDLNARYARVGEAPVLVVDASPDPQVLQYQLPVVPGLGRVPVGLPVLHDPQPETDGMGFVAHLQDLPSLVYYDGYVARALGDAPYPASGPGSEPFQGAGTVGDDLNNYQGVRVH